MMSLMQRFLSGAISRGVFLGAVLALVMPVAAAQAAKHISIFDNSRSAISYALVQAGQHIVFAGDDRELVQVKDRVKAYRRDLGSEYLWVRREDQQYLLTDPALIAAVKTLWQPVEPHEQEMETLSEEMQTYTDQLEDAAADLEASLSSDGYPSRTATEAFERISRPLQAKIDPLSERMSELGEEIERLSDAAHQQTLSLIASAIADAKVMPLR